MHYLTGLTIPTFKIYRFPVLIGNVSASLYISKKHRTSVRTNIHAQAQVYSHEVEFISFYYSVKIFTDKQQQKKEMINTLLQLKPTCAIVNKELSEIAIEPK